MTKLNLACGPMYLKGYINIDDNSHGGYRVDKQANVFDLDYAENSVDEIVLSHFRRKNRSKKSTTQKFVLV